MCQEGKDEPPSGLAFLENTPHLGMRKTKRRKRLNTAVKIYYVTIIRRRSHGKESSKSALLLPLLENDRMVGEDSCERTDATETCSQRGVRIA